jgi:hypothetical protein
MTGIMSPSCSFSEWSRQYDDVTPRNVTRRASLTVRRAVTSGSGRALLRDRNLVIAVALASMFAATFGSMLYFLSIYRQDALGYDALQAGMAFLLPTAVVVTGSTVAGQLVTRFGLRGTLVAALAVGAGPAPWGWR